ncbi:AAA family ATPase [Nocardia terpenica]|uniref:AAA family ATPase n=1 Tax=Nocardia terpenica TaxID=455432 RepID=UPI001894C9AF|nr:AAA family ATPase [Nocardia terpenica]MBF6063140.1 AAA family ATPase [Nocardia terpenica]MBF6105696.1 AAA family ATPase [Nocardia terpenica]MBF6113720.1 AAA family ATPase [Nocardia terpenica]MBF6119437.1 AAA family ATPase [Nocardia terpenica]MBF6151848.1 AAA family ATPase [Nocardia terpenica]
MPEGPEDPAPRLAELVSRRLDSDPSVTPEVARAVLEALGAGPDGTFSDPGYTGIFLRAIRVRGFRGIGREAALTLNPGPGLTLVVGRNGSGKSSFAEAAELALTGVNQRWEGRSGVWREGWRNLHEGSESRIEVDLAAAGPDPTFTVVREWPADADLTGGAWLMRRKDKPPTDFCFRDWARSLELYRPFLSYSELGALVDGRPSDLFDALHQLLGLDDLTAAQERTRMRRLELERAARQSRDERQALLAALTTVADERAVRVAQLLRTAEPDLRAIAREVAGARHDPTGAAALQAILRLDLPEPVEVEAAAERVERCAADLAAHATGDSEAELRVLDLLRRARAHVAVGGACACPVCGQGVLDPAWQRDTDAEIARLTDRAAALTTARIALRQAVEDALALVKPVPVELNPPAPQAPNIDTGPALRTWSAWAALAETDYRDDLPERLRVAHADAARGLDTLRRAARKELDRLDAVWTPLVPRIAAWLQEATAVAAAEPELRTVRRAEDWLKSAAAGLRDQRMVPLADHARRIWRGLRQQSNVDLGAIRLQGNAGATRKVQLDVTVDETGGTALGVMSQGELHALGLALFLPRATIPESPFGFVVIDDPVQAMDPAKVDGLARVLAAAARSGRQVVVFTHDERLAEAVRRLRLDATVLDVQRRERSTVEVRVAEDPVRRYLSDANALLRTRQLPRAIAAELVITCCRSAIEAAALARARRSLLEAGVDHREVQRRVENARTTWEKVSLAVLGDPDRVDDLNELLDRDTPWARAVLRDAAAGAHIRIDRSGSQLISGTRRLVKWLNP